jgi:DNA-cytosine methyltransferase
MPRIIESDSILLSNYDFDIIDVDSEDDSENFSPIEPVPSEKEEVEGYTNSNAQSTASIGPRSQTDARVTSNPEIEDLKPTKRSLRSSANALAKEEEVSPEPHCYNRTRSRRRFQKAECVSVPPLLVPKSKYANWTHSLPVCDERSALSNILDRTTEMTSPDFHNILLEDFVIYRDDLRTHYPGQMVTLDNIVSLREGCKYLLNGVLRCGDLVRYVQAVEIDIDAISIDGFEDTDVHSVHDMVYLQTTIAARRRHKARRCWYQLGEPAAEYRELYEKFLWVADLAKHVIDYLYERFRLDGSRVPLRDFRSEFLKFLVELHGGNERFQKWRELFKNKTDFRVPINRHREFIFGRAYNLGGHYLRHDLWSDMMLRPASALPDDRGPEDTVVTPFVKSCCELMPWAYVLKSESISAAVQEARQRRAAAMGFSLFSARISGMKGNVAKSAALLERAAHLPPPANIRAEDALRKFAIVRLRKPTKTAISYIYIQKVEYRHGRAELKVLHVCLPSETICADGYYPHGDELFLSADCNCSSVPPIRTTDIIQVIPVTFGDHPQAGAELFIQQRYVHSEAILSRLKESDLSCHCHRPAAFPPKDVVDGNQRAPRKPLSGLSLFTGCGNFDLGLEASGAVDVVAAVEIKETPLKTYAANRSRGLEGLVLNSVNCCLSDVFKGIGDLPDPTSIDIVISGNPCKGFSLINRLRSDDRGMRNCSLVASAISYIETYLPLYAILENVEAMDNGDGNSCNQLIACLAGLGYQVRKMVLDSRDFGSSQRRRRLFVVAAAPRVLLPERPEPVCKSLGSFSTAATASNGLPPMDNDGLICLSHPDHIAGAKQTPMFRELMRRVPRFPKKMGFLSSIKAGCQGEAQLEWFKSRGSLNRVKNHVAFTRIDPSHYIPTITTTPNPCCSRGGGRIIHWDQHRTLTFLEVRRGQGIPDEEVIVGDLQQQWAQVGNAVNRQVATALGKSIAQSWLSGEYFMHSPIFTDLRITVGPSTLEVTIPQSGSLRLTSLTQEDADDDGTGDASDGSSTTRVEPDHVLATKPAEEDQISRYTGESVRAVKAEIWQENGRNEGQPVIVCSSPSSSLHTSHSAENANTCQVMQIWPKTPSSPSMPMTGSLPAELGSASHPIDLDAELPVPKRRRLTRILTSPTSHSPASPNSASMSSSSELPDKITNTGNGSITIDTPFSPRERKVRLTPASGLPKQEPGTPEIREDKNDHDDSDDSDDEAVKIWTGIRSRHRQDGSKNRSGASTKCAISITIDLD